MIHNYIVLLLIILSWGVGVLTGYYGKKDSKKTPTSFNKAKEEDIRTERGGDANNKKFDKRIG